MKTTTSSGTIFIGAASRNQGFSLVELMVGLVIGLLATMVIMQVYATFEGQKRASTGGADAQTNGSVALYNIQREGMMAGYGLSFSNTLRVFDCPDPLPTIDHDNDAGTPEAGIFPVEIAEGGDSDTVTIRYGSTPFGGVNIPITTVAGTAITVDDNLGCQVGDVALLIAAAPAQCALGKVAALPSNTQLTLSAAPAVTSGEISCMGTWNEVTFAVTNNMLDRNGVPSVADIVSIQAQYGVKSAGTAIDDNIVATWENAPAGALTRAYRQRIRAIRVAVVARSGLYEKEVVSYPCDAADPKPNQMCAFVGQPGGNVDIAMSSADLPAGQEWDHFRYRIFDAVIPMRNLVWQPKL